jgi:ABC-2 type transport system permease protein
VNRAVFLTALRLRLLGAILAAVGMFIVIVMVGALFPSIGDSIGRLHVPDGVANLLGGADYSTISGWMRSEIGAIYGPLVIGASAIAAASATTAGEEERGILGLVLSHPVTRGRLVIDKAAAVAVVVLVVAFGTWVGLLTGVAVAGGGIPVANITALSLSLACFGFALGGLSLALAGTTGRKSVAVAGAGAFAVVGFVVNGFAPLVDGLDWLEYLSPFYYYTGHDPLTRGFDWAGVVVLTLATVALVTVAVVGIQRRDLRA